MSESENQYYGIESCYELAELEYEHELERNEKLDNKINITLTFCGVLFLFVLKYLDFMKIFEYDKVILNSDFMTFVKLIVVSSTILLCYYFGKCVYMLFDNMETRGYKHYESKVIFDKDLPSSSNDRVKYYNTFLLVKATKHNHKVNEIRAQKYNLSIKYIKKTILCIVIIEFMTYTFFR